jgi:hypothetical protein
MHHAIIINDARRMHTCTHTTYSDGAHVESVLCVCVCVCVCVYYVPVVVATMVLSNPEPIIDGINRDHFSYCTWVHKAWGMDVPGVLAAAYTPFVDATAGQGP